MTCIRYTQTTCISSFWEEEITWLQQRGLLCGCTATRGQHTNAEFERLFTTMQLTVNDGLARPTHEEFNAYLSAIEETIK